MNESPEQLTNDSRTLALFPGALGDFLCFLPIAHSLRSRCASLVTLVANEAHRPLVDPSLFELISIDRREISSLFSTQPNDTAVQLLGRYSEVLSWTGATNANFLRNLARLTSGRARVFPFRGFSDGEHAVDYFARCADTAVVDAPLFLTTAAREWALELARRRNLTADTLAIHPGSGSPTKNWEGMADLAKSWRRQRGPVVVIVGPAESTTAVRRIPVQDCDAVVENQGIDRVGALLHHLGRFLGNDSGVAHLAAAAGCTGLVLFGDTDPTIWRPLGQLKVLHKPNRCAQCGVGRFCIHRASVEDVYASLELASHDL